jgi:osomolarity two-component system response regulator SKN7
MVYPIGHTHGIDPMYSEHIHNIPYPMPAKGAEGLVPMAPGVEPRKKNAHMDPGWIRQPQILLVEDDQTCRRIGGKFLSAFLCSIDGAVSWIEIADRMDAELTMNSWTD